jgi:hypothetical protein
MSTFLSTSSTAQINLHILRRDFFDGFSLLLQDSNGEALDLNTVQVCASIWKRNTDGSFSQVLSLNVEKQEPLDAGRVRFWLTSAQTSAIWDAYEASVPTVDAVFFPSAYATSILAPTSSPLVWDVRIEEQEYLADLVSVASGVFVSQENHALASSERTIFLDTAQASINYNGTGARIYSGMTNISYQAPYSFTVPSLSGVTDAAIGGSVYRLKQDTVVAGNVFVGQTLSNCFP